MASCRFWSPIRGELKVIQYGHFWLEPMECDHHNVKREAIDPPNSCLVTINGVELLICIIFIAITKGTQNNINLLFVVPHTFQLKI